MVEDETNKHKSFKIEYYLNKRTIKKGKGLGVEYLVCWMGYSPKWDR